MSFQERRSIVYLINIILIFSAYMWYVLQLNQEGRLESTNWGTVILILVPVHVVVSIITSILLSIVNVIVTNEEEPQFSDELDKSIELRATRNSFYTFMIGFLISMATVAGELPMYVMFNALVGSLYVAEVVWVFSAIYYYRRGF